MAYLYLNFLDNLEEGSKNWDDFYMTSLKEQFNDIKRKIGGEISSIQDFLARAFPTEYSKKYYISLPSFDRRVQENRRGRASIFNIVIRPEKDTLLSSIVPSKFDLIIIGDVTFGSVIDITVKGMELIDSNLVKFGEIEVNCNVRVATASKTITYREKIVNVPDYGSSDLKDAVLTRDFVDELCSEKYPVPNPEAAISAFNKWRQYINFRKYYLGKLSERCEEIESVTVCNSYMITKETYKRNQDIFKDLLLDGILEFSKGEQIILSEKVDGSESFPLIRVEISKNRKEILSDTIGKFGHVKSKYEVNLQRYTKDAMGLSQTPPSYDEKGNIKKGYRFKQYLLGERYLLTHVDIEPDCSDLEKQLENDINSAFDEIDDKYKFIIDKKVNEFVENQKYILEEKNESEFKSYVKELKDNLKKDVEENKDSEIKRKIEEEIKKISSAFDKKITEAKKDANEEISEINKSKKEQKVKSKKIDLIKEKLKKQIDKLEKEKEREISKISLHDYYVSRNERLIENKKKSLNIELSGELNRIKEEKRKELIFEYKDQVKKEKEEKNSILNRQFEIDKSSRIENETIRKYQIYFRPDSDMKKFSEIKKEIEGVKAKYLTYDNRANKAKIDRQEKALDSFTGGYVRNPFLATYLFSPESLISTSVEDLKDPDWYLESLNDRQKVAVKKALASESLFLLQGPPGTGKTQVIAEITAQLAKRGKKVLISSETHKAIDNVFERLPKIPEIRPLRLIPTQIGKESNYSPERLVDNLYLNISGNLKKQIKRFEHFEEYEQTFSEQMNLLRKDYDKLLSLKKENINIDNQRSKLLLEINRNNDSLELLREKERSLNNELDKYRRTIKYIETLRFSFEVVEEKFIEDFKSKIEKLILSLRSINSFSIDSASELFNIDINEIKEEISQISSDDSIVKLEMRIDKLRSELNKLKNEYEEYPKEGEENYDQYKKYHDEFVELIDREKRIKKEGSFDFSASKVYKLNPSIAENKDLLKRLPEDLTSFRIQAQTIIDEEKESVEKEQDEVIYQLDKIKEEILDVQIEINKRKQQYEELRNNPKVEESYDLSLSLKKKITGFFRDFDIIAEYDSDDFDKAFSIISNEWNRIKNEYEKNSDQNKKKISLYGEICKYLEEDDILEEDRKTYTRELYNCANVFGITCTSRDRFTKSQLVELGNYGIESVDIKTQGIDVVIIDEVSKSSFIDLLIPILYGKTVILVGDHRQLPPMYDLQHMRKEDFEGLDENIITKDINESYRKLYEESFFKTLYERVPLDFKVMLNKQYRCHSHIMEVFNHFYGGNENGLVVGKKQQDDEKQHNLTIKIKGNTIIEPRYHVYFIDCEEKESSAYEGSTSKINEQEAEVAIELLKQIDKASVEAIKSGKVRVNEEKKIDERLSAGIICTYGDQASLIKKKRKGQRFDGFSKKEDEKLIISTVDDFQGDERDVIIVSMVRNPLNTAKANAEFITKFERINVALSRARKLLIVIGSKKYLSEAGIIDLPDLTGNHFLDKKNFRVYKEIIDTISFRGKILTAEDIIGDEINYGR